jgi:hypothetical protein
MSELTDLLALPERELDARLAECMEPKPKQSPTDQWPWSDYSLRGAWQGEMPNGKPKKARWIPRAYSSPRSPRELIEGVEAEIERRGLTLEYIDALCDLYEAPFGNGLFEARRVLLADAKHKCAAAVWVMERKNVRL